MNIINKLPGPLLVFLGACSLSFGGLIVKSFEGATLWQILFWRSLFFSLTVLTFLIISYRQKTFKAFKDSGFPGFIGGIILSFGFCAAQNGVTELAFPAISCGVFAFAQRPR